MKLDAHSCRGSPASSNIPLRNPSISTSQDVLLAPRSNQQISRLKSCLAKTPGASAVVSSGPMPLPSPFASRQEQVITIALCCTASLYWDINMAQARHITGCAVAAPQQAQISRPNFRLARTPGGVIVSSGGLCLCPYRLPARSR